MPVVSLRGLDIGSGEPKICVPILGRDRDEIMTSAHVALSSGADIFEFRCDHFESFNDDYALESILRELRDTIGGIPIILTLRGLKEGGRADVGYTEYLRICRVMAESGCGDMLDMEYARIKGSGRDNPVAFFRERGMKIIISMHDTESTPSLDDMLYTLLRMEELGGDILKIAVTPAGRMDVIRLLEASVLASARTDRPLVMISMGEIGKPSRYLCDFAGSAFTFASASLSSAPGQIEAGRMRELLGMISAVK